MCGLFAAGQFHQIVIPAANARNRKGAAEMRMVTPEGVCQSMEIYPEASRACAAIRVHRVAIVKKISKRLDQHGISKQPKSLGRKLSRDIHLSMAPRQFGQ